MGQIATKLGQASVMYIKSVARRNDSSQHIGVVAHNISMVWAIYFIYDKTLDLEI